MTDLPAINDFRAMLRGPLLTPGDADYESARKVYNGMIDRRPGLIARCVDVADVIHCVNYARTHQLLLAVRGGGHNAGGLGICDEGPVADLSRMKGIHIDPQARTARVEAGCTWGDVDHATHAFGLACPSGIVSTTGVAGLTLGGGIGHLARSCGLTIDNLLGVDMVLADGSLVSVDERRLPDLYWAIRGGGGNFGIVTSFLLRLHPVKNVVAGPTLWPLEQAADVLRWYRDFLPAAPRELSGFFATLMVPPAPPFPPELHMKRMCGVVWCYNGDAQRAAEVLKPVAEFGPPALHAVGEMPFPALQSAFDGLYVPGMQWYWRGDFVDRLSDEAISAHLQHLQVPTLWSTMHLYPVDGAVHDVPETHTAFSYRSSTWAQVIVGVDPDPANRQLVTDWTRRYHDALHPHSAGGAYVNFMMEEGQERVQATYRGNYDRLVQVKRRYDPDNLFRVNQNIRGEPRSGNAASSMIGDSDAVAATAS